MNEAIIMVIYIVALIALMYFLMVRPQKKEQRMEALLSSLEVGDSVCTTAGFYGVVIGMEEEMVIVEFGSNKNCRIPMKKSSIVEVEKA